MSISTGKAILFGLIPFGPLYLRMFKLNGSIDHMWTAIPFFQMPIFGLIPTLMMKFGKIKKGKLKGSPFDFFVIVTIILRFLVDFMVDKLDEPWASTFNVLLNLFCIMLPFMIRIYAPLCSLCKSNPIQGFNVILKILSSSAIMMAIIEALIIGLGYVPYIGKIPTVLNMIPVVGPMIVYALYFIPLYVITNIYRENTLGDFCNKKAKKTFAIPATIVSIVVFVILKKISGFDPSSFSPASFGSGIQGNITNFATNYAEDFASDEFDD